MAEPVGRDRALLLALAALHEVADAGGRGPVQPSVWLRALLAMVHARSNGDRAPYQAFWHRTLGLEPQDASLRESVGELIAQQREITDPEWRRVREAARAIRVAKYDREIVSTKDRPHSEVGQRLMANRIARGEGTA